MGTSVTLYLVALLVRLALIAAFPDPAYPDSSYYVNVARSLAEGRGFEVDFVWIFAEVGGRLPDQASLPIASNAHWMPLASIVQVPFIAVLGATPVASALPFALIGSIAAPLTFHIARDAGLRHSRAIAAGLLTAIPALSLVYLVQPDNFSLFQPLVAGALWMATRGMAGSNAAFVLAGLLAGVATLSRNDGVLVLAVLGFAFLWSRWRGRDANVFRLSPAAAVGAVAAFLLVVGPWWLRQLTEFGSLSPSTASGRVLFIRSIEEWNSITSPATLDHLLGQGIGPLVASRIGGLVAAVSIFVTLVGGVLLAPLMAIGAWHRRGDRRFGPFFAYAFLLFAFSAVVSAVHVPGGTFIHSAVALAPHGYILAVEGLRVAVGWIAARRRTWHAPSAERVFLGGLLPYVAIVAVAGSVFVHDSWRGVRDDRLAVAAALDAAGAPREDRLMTIDAAGYRYHAGRGGVVLVNDPIDTIESVASAYGIRWLIVERRDAVPAVVPILEGRGPSWIGPAVYERENGVGATALAVYPVCLATADPRCAAR